MSLHSVVPPRGKNADKRTNELSGDGEWGVTHVMPKIKGKRTRQNLSPFSVEPTWLGGKKHNKYPHDV